MRELIEELRDRVRSLEGQLSEEREARRRADTIIMQLIQANASLAARLPELVEAPQDGQEDVREPRQDVRVVEERQAEFRPWWRRIFWG